MGMGLGLYFRQDLGIELTLAQKLELRLKLKQRQNDLKDEMDKERFFPRAICPQCMKKLTLEEIRNGFSDDPNVFTVICPRCKRDFVPKLINKGKMSNYEIVFYCPQQVLHRLPKYEKTTPETFLKEDPALYRSALQHFHSLNSAFEEIGIGYTFDAINTWQTKIMPYLGKMPDTWISEAVQVPINTIRYYRKKLGITPFRWSDYYAQ